MTLRDLPATVVDLLGLSAGSPIQGRSLAAYWSAPESGRVAPEVTTVAFSEQVDLSVCQGGPATGLGGGGVQMSLVAQGHHYIRDGLGAERLFDLRIDPYERENIKEHTDSKERLGAFRKLLLEFLTDNPASPEVEHAYLKRYKAELEKLIRHAAASRSIELTRMSVARQGGRERP